MPSRSPGSDEGCLAETPGAGCDALHSSVCVERPHGFVRHIPGVGGNPAIIRTKLPCVCPDRPASLGPMCTTYDPQHEAEAAMKRAVAADGPDRQRLIELALAWHQLARDRREDGAA
jgi:hypothetical protein